MQAQLSLREAVSLFLKERDQLRKDYLKSLQTCEARVFALAQAQARVQARTLERGDQLLRLQQAVLTAYNSLHGEHQEQFREQMLEMMRPLGEMSRPSVAVQELSLQESAAERLLLRRMLEKDEEIVSLSQQVQRLRGALEGKDSTWV